LGVGLVVYIGQRLLEPSAMRTEEGAHGADALTADVPTPRGAPAVETAAEKPAAPTGS
jgi:hypothetical protein